MTTETLSVLDLLKQNYPSQYYGIPNAEGTLVSTVLDVWNAKTSADSPMVLTGLPAASSLVPMTATQFALAKGALFIGITGTALNFPARYYAKYDTVAAQPTGVTGWFDAWTLTTTANLPVASDMLALTEAEWSARMTGPQGVKDDALVAYTAPAVVVPLKTQASTELNWISSQATMAAAMGETFTADMKTYVKAVQAIANGTDTKSTVLPTRPTDIMS